MEMESSQSNNDLPSYIEGLTLIKKEFDIYKMENNFIKSK